MNLIKNIFSSSHSEIYLHQVCKLDVIEIECSIDPLMLEDILTYSLNQIKKSSN